MEPEDSAWSEEIFHALIENLEDITYLSDPYTYELLYVSPQVRDILGLSGNDPIGKNVTKYFKENINHAHFAQITFWIKSRSSGNTITDS